MEKTPKERAEEALEAMKWMDEHPMDRPYTGRQEPDRDWSVYNTARQNQYSLFIHLITDLTDYIDDPQDTGGRGRPRTPLSTIIQYAVLREYTKADLRKVEGLLDVLNDAGLIETSCNYTTVSRRMQEVETIQALQHLIHVSSLPFANLETVFAADATGLPMHKYDRYFTMKYGGEEKERQWKKLHLMVGVESTIATAARVTDGHSHESPVFTTLLDDTGKLFQIEEVLADKAYSSRENLDAVDEYGGTPYIPFQRNVTGNAGGSYTWMRMYQMFQENTQKFRRHYHKRSNVESAFGSIKARFDHDLDARNETSLQAEALCKVLCHNICVIIDAMYELGLDPGFSVEKTGDSVEKILEFRE